MKVKTKRNRKIPISSATTAGSARGPAVSHRVTQSTIAQFHTLLKRQAALKSKLKGCSSDGSVAALQDDLSRIEKEMEELGGLEAYQEASKLGQSRERGGDSSKVLVQWLVEMGMKTSTIKGKGKLRMLEIGALTPDNYAACSSWIQNHPIDLNSQHPSIKQQDFFERPLPTSEEERFDLISCSLVLNFVNSPAERAETIYLIVTISGATATLSDKLPVSLGQVVRGADDYDRIPTGEREMAPRRQGGVLALELADTSSAE